MRYRKLNAEHLIQCRKCKLWIEFYHTNCPICGAPV